MMVRAALLLGLVGCPQTQQEAEEVAMTIGSVVSAGGNCNWDGSGGPLRTGQNGPHQRRLTRRRHRPQQALPHRGAVGSKLLCALEASDEPGSAFGDSFITLKDVEVRLVFDDAVVLPPTDETRANLPASYVVPTMGTQDVGTPPIAVFDLIPTWVTQRLALDRQIQMARHQHGLQPRHAYTGTWQGLPARHRVSAPRAQRRR